MSSANHAIKNETTKMQLGGKVEVSSQPKSPEETTKEIQAEFTKAFMQAMHIIRQFKETTYELPTSPFRQFLTETLVKNKKTCQDAVKNGADPYFYLKEGNVPKHTLQIALERGSLFFVKLIASGIGKRGCGVNLDTIANYSKEEKDIRKFIVTFLKNPL